MIARFAALALFISISLPAVAQVPSDTVPTLQADGQGQVMVVPDIAIVTLGVVTRAATADAALAMNSTDLQSVIDAIKAQGVAEKDIGTSGFSVSPVYQTVPRPPANAPPPIVGYSVSNDVSVTIRAIATSGAILDKVVSAGANQVASIAFDISDRTTPEDQATQAAITDARRRAQIMADAAGVTLGRVLSVSSSTIRPQGPVFAAAAVPAPIAPVLSGQQMVTANASITWEIGPK
jgi:uncharacterized protein YggE